MSGAAAPAVALAAEERELIRSLILSDPGLVLEDDQVMRALIGAQQTGIRNIVDLRDRLVERLEGRLKRLAETNRTVIAAAYEAVSGIHQLHRAVLALLEAEGVGPFLRCLTAQVPAILGVDEARLCFEGDVPEACPAELAPNLGGRVVLLPEGMIDDYLTLDGAQQRRDVVLRACGAEAELIFGRFTPARSEALMRLDLGGMTALMAFGAADLDRFTPDQGTDLLRFFAGVLEAMLPQRLDEQAATP